MKEKMKIDAVEMVRRIRDQQARELSGKSPAEIIAFFREAAQKCRDQSSRPQSDPNS